MSFPFGRNSFVVDRKDMEELDERLSDFDRATETEDDAEVIHRAWCLAYAARAVLACTPPRNQVTKGKDLIHHG